MIAYVENLPRPD